jgi:hypothetical protein
MVHRVIKKSAFLYIDFFKNTHHLIWSVNHDARPTLAYLCSRPDAWLNGAETPQNTPGTSRRVVGCTVPRSVSLFFIGLRASLDEIAQVKDRQRDGKIENGKHDTQEEIPACQ